MNLSLMSHIVAADMAYIVLQRIDATSIRYFFLASEVSHRVVTTGVIEGEMSKDISAYTIMLSSINLLTSKDFRLALSFKEDKLIFNDTRDRFKLNPLCVESMDNKALDSLKVFMDFYEVLQRNREDSQLLSQLETTLLGERDRMDSVRTLSFEGETAPPTEHENREVERLETEAAELKQRIAANGLVEVDMSSCKSAAFAAARFHSTVEVYDGNAVVQVGSGSSSSYLFCKDVPGNYCIHGALLNKLLVSASRDGGKFYDYNRQLVYRVVTKDKKKKGQEESAEISETIVFVSKYLPRAEVDTSLLLRGTVEEKYTFSFEQVVSIAALSASTFPTFTLDLGYGLAKLSNEQAESIEIPLEIGEARSIQLNRMLNGKDTGNDLMLATVTLPKQVRSLLSLFKGSVTLYVKKSKIIMNSGNNWLVFGRG